MILLAASAWAGVVDVAAGAADDTFAARRVALLIGVQEYTDPALQGLRFPTKDAQDLGVVLSSPDLGGFDEVRVISGAATTSRSALLQAFRDATDDLQRDDTFLLYLSGHGTLTLDPIEGSRLWFLPSDARLDDPGRNGLAVEELERLISELPARRRVLVLDTCHNGRAGSKSSLSEQTSRQMSGLRGEPPAPRAEREVAESEARLFAAQYYQPAMEDPTLQNGVYTHFLLESLSGARGTADLDGNSLVDVVEAHNYARDRTIAYTGGMQVPRYEYRNVGREEIYLSGRATQRSAAEQALISAYDRVLEKARLLVNGIPRGELPGLYAVEPGPQTVEIQTSDGRTLAKRRVNLSAGRRLELEELVAGNRSAPELLIGATAHTGHWFNTVQTSAAVAWVRPFPVAGAWRPDLHLSGSYASGAFPNGIEGQSGSIGAGVTWGVVVGPAWFGPGADLRVPIRASSEEAPQYTVTGAGMLSAGAGVPVGGHQSLQLRVDAEVLPLPHLGGLDVTYGVTARVGLRFGK